MIEIFSEDGNVQLQFPNIALEVETIYEVKDLDINFWTLNFDNPKIANRIIKKAKISFKIKNDEDNFSTNHVKLITLFNSMKPYISEYFLDTTDPNFFDNVQQDAFQIAMKNNNGLIFINADDYFDLRNEKMHVTSFSFNREEGYPYDQEEGVARTTSYIVTIEGNILQDLEDTITII